MLLTGNSKGLRQGRPGNLAGFVGSSDSGNRANIFSKQEQHQSKLRKR